MDGDGDGDGESESDSDGDSDGEGDGESRLKGIRLLMGRSSVEQGSGKGGYEVER